jgi:integrase
MASLKLRGDTWYIVWLESGRKRARTTKTTNKNVAKGLLREFEEKEDHDTNPTKAHPVSQILQAYVDHLNLHGQPGRVQRDVRLMRDAFGECCPALTIDVTNPWSKHRKRERDVAIAKGDPRYATIEAKDFDRLSTPLITDWLTKLYMARGLKPRAGNRYRQVLSALCTFAIDQRGVHFPKGINPVFKVPRFREPKPKIQFMKLKEIEEQLAALAGNTKYQTMVAVLIFAGLRRSEMLWLQQQDVDLGKGIIHVRAKEVFGKKWRTKTGQDRDVPINGALRGYLERYCVAPSRGDWYFPSKNGVRIDEHKFTHYLAKLNFLNRFEVAENRKQRYFAKKFSKPMPVEVKPDKLLWNAKIYRHTYASQLAARGASLFEIAKLMGNSHTVCERYYADLCTNSARNVIEFGNAPEPVKAQGHGKGGSAVAVA